MGSALPLSRVLPRAANVDSPGGFAVDVVGPKATVQPRSTKALPGGKIDDGATTNRIHKIDQSMVASRERPPCVRHGLGGPGPVEPDVLKELSEPLREEIKNGWCMSRLFGPAKWVCDQEWVGATATGMGGGRRRTALGMPSPSSDSTLRGGEPT